MSHSYGSLDATPNAQDALWRHYLHKDHRQSEAFSPSVSRRKRPALRNYVAKSKQPLTFTIVPVWLEDNIIYDFPAQRPAQLAFGTLWMGSEPDVDQTFLLWDNGLGHVPNETVYASLRAFEAGNDIGTMTAELKTGLVHMVAVAMLNNRLSASGTTINQIQYLLLEAYHDLESQKRVLALNNPKPSLEVQRRHWLWGSMRPRTDELEWLKYQGERRWWLLTKRDFVMYYRRLKEPTDSELDALFYAYVHHQEG